MLQPAERTWLNRLSKIVTRTGDAGTTGLGDGSRVGKDSARIAAIGEIDELNSHAGRAARRDAAGRRCASSSSASSTTCSTSAASCRFPATRGDRRPRRRASRRRSRRFNADLAPLKEFILPGGAAARPRSRTSPHRLPPRRARAGPPRRAEPVGDPARRYLNRLSDLLFVLGARAEPQRRPAATCCGRRAATRRELTAAGHGQPRRQPARRTTWSMAPKIVRPPRPASRCGRGRRSA